MKISTMNAIYSALTSVDFENKEAVMTDLYNEIHRGDKVKAEKAALYDANWPIVQEFMTEVVTAPISVADLYESLKGKFTEGFTKAKLSYALTHQWADRMTKTEGKVNTYALRA